MTNLNLVYHSIKSRGISSMLSILLTAFGLALAILITQFSNHFQNRLLADGKNIDVVVGAKGSPLQLILSSVYHVDIPTGNIPFKSVESIIKHPQVKNFIPLALGDNWKGFRIVGTSYKYLDNYEAELKEGRLWNNDFEVIAGSSVNISIDEEFSGAHGLFEGGNIHDDTKYKVVGILKKTGTVLDRLILTSVNSVLALHDHEGIEEFDKMNEQHIHDDSLEHKEHHDTHKHEKHHDDINIQEKGHDIHNHEENRESHEHEKYIDSKEYTNIKNKHTNPTKSEITAILIETKSPIANVNLPRQINKESLLQAANPAFEMSRLIILLGLGSKSFALLSGIIILIAVLSIFSGLAGTLENRVGDLTILRAIGYSKKRVFKLIALEGFLIVSIGIFIGIILGFSIFAFCAENLNILRTSQANITITPELFIIIISVLFAGLIASFLPAYKSTKINVANQLSKNV